MDSYINIALVISFCAWIIAQTLKVIGGVIREKKLDLSFFIRSGGMPSAHTALVSSLAVSLGILEGFNSTLFAVAAVFAAIVMYDAAGVRRSVSKQSEILNRILQELKERRPKDVQNDVRELIGHTPFQVFTGGVLGTIFALAWLALSGNIHL
jgi:acid phosphatase family membrane protein YuiD